MQKSGLQSEMKPILIFSLQRGINEFSKVSGFLSQNTAEVLNYLRKSIFALSLAKNSRIISINWYSRKCLYVSSEVYIIGKEDNNLKGRVFETSFMPTFWF